MKARPSSLTLALVLAAAPLAPAHAAASLLGGAATEVPLELGKGQLLHLDHPAATVFVADPKVADVQVKSPTLVYLYGKAPGSTSLYAVDGRDQVVADLAVNVGVDPARVAAVLKSQFPESQVAVSVAGDALVLSGKVASAAEGADLLRTAARFLPAPDKAGAGRLINRLTVDAPNQVNLRVRVAEVSRQANEILGFNWQALVGVGQGVVGLATGNPVFTDATPRQIAGRTNGADNLFAGYQHGSTDINLLVDALKQKGLVTVLAEPNLTAVSGEPASFLAGGEYPIPVPQPGGGNQVTIDYKKYGVSLDFVATVLDGGRISLNVRPEVSQLTTSGAITLNGLTVPALTTRRAETTVDLASGQSFAIGGLLQNTTSQDVKTFPGLGDIPVLGTLFRSKQYQKSESELVIIVTPYLVKPVDRKLATPADLLAPVEAAAAEPSKAQAEPKTKG